MICIDIKRTVIVPEFSDEQLFFLLDLLGLIHRNIGRDLWNTLLRR